MRYTRIARLAAVAAIAVSLLGCGQDDVEFPEAGEGGECGSWYASVEGGVKDSYTFSAGETCPCFVWESVRIGSSGGEANAYINIGEIYLQNKHGKTDALEADWGIAEPRALVLVISAKECPQCPGTLSDIVDLRADFEAAGALMVGVCRTSMQGEEQLSLEEADYILLEKDFWPEDWHRTNDAEQHLALLNGFPQAAVVRLSDMKIVHHDGIYGASNLLAVVQDVDQL